MVSEIITPFKLPPAFVGVEWVWPGDKDNNDELKQLLKEGINLTTNTGKLREWQAKAENLLIKIELGGN